MGQMAKPSFKINQIIFIIKRVSWQNQDSKLILQNSNRLENFLKIVYHLGFIEKNVSISKSLISFLRIFVKSNNYSIITKIHKKLSI